MFANQSIASDKAAFTFRAHGDRIMLMNPDHKMTEEQERLSQRGLSFHESDRQITRPPVLDNDDNDDDNEQANAGTGQLLLPAENKVDDDGDNND